MAAEKIFWNEDGTLRSGWRVVAFGLLFSFTLGILAVTLQLALRSFGALETYPRYLFWLSSGLLSLFTALLIGWACGKYFEKLPFGALGASPSLRASLNLVLGLAAGALTVGAAVAIASILGGERFEWNLTSTPREIGYTLIVSFIVFGVAAAAEEALFRGYILQTLDRAGFAWLAVSLTSAFFGLVHFDNPNAGIISTLNTVLAGIWFSLAYLKFRDLWFVTGMHLTWNWVQGSIFGIEVSGLTEISEHPVLREIDSGPTWLTGETYGIEGGIAATLAILASIAAIALLKSSPRSPS